VKFCLDLIFPFTWEDMVYINQLISLDNYSGYATPAMILVLWNTTVYPIISGHLIYKLIIPTANLGNLMISFDFYFLVGLYTSI